MVYGRNFMQCICTGYCESWILSLPSFIGLSNALAMWKVYHNYFTPQGQWILKLASQMTSAKISLHSVFLQTAVCMANNTIK